MSGGGKTLVADRASRWLMEVREMRRQYVKETRAKAFFRRLRWHIRNTLPQEIRDMIIVEYLHLVLLPGKIFPQQRPDRFRRFEHFSQLYMRANPIALLTTNRRTFADYRAVYWSQNKWIIGPGTGDKAVGFLLRMPNHAMRLIKAVEINFTIRDIEVQLWSSYQFRLGRILGETFPSDDDRELPETVLRAVSHYLLNLWDQKFAILTELDLDELTLDFTDTVMPDGKFCGVALARRWRPFVRQFPKQLNIWAPNGDIRDELYDIIRDRNRHLLEDEPW
ncbi:MAG: hypothetical protein Q9223_004809 [Gallowayella weberi]